MLRLLGFVHLLTATGIHLYALAAAVSWIARASLTAIAVPASTGVGLARALSALAWMHAWLLCGARPGMLRPLLLVGTRQVARVIGFRWAVWSPLICALGFDLSVALLRHALGLSGAWAPGRAVYALAVGGGMMVNQAWPGHLALALGSWALAGLHDAWVDGRVAPLTPLISLVTLPIYTIFVYPVALLSEALRALGADLASQHLLESVVRFSDNFMQAMARAALVLPALWVVPRWALAGGALAAGAVLASAHSATARRRARAAGAILVVLACLGARELLTRSRDFTPASAGRVLQLDVGQGDAALILWQGLMPGHWSAGLVDVGGERALGEAWWIELLARQGVSELDFVALTHLDEDHAGGLRRLARLIPIHCAATSNVQLEAERGVRLASELAHVDVPFKDWSSGCFPFPVLGPPESTKDTQKNGGMSAMVVPLATGASWINAGDAEPEEEPRLLHWASEVASHGPRILKITHHGSRFSSLERDLREVAPTEAWISAGRGNRYGHPSVIILDRLEKLAIPIHRTDREGMISTSP